jgi:hypothetical protein
MPTSRNLSRKVFQCGRYEAQDVLVESDAVDLIELEAGRGFRFKEKWQLRLLYHDVTRKLAFVNPGIQPVRLTKDYDLFLVVCQTYWDLLHANAVEGWKDRCRTSVCWIDELWAASLPLEKHWLPSLKRFDHVVLGMNGTVAALGEIIGRPCHYLVGGVDALRFSPYPGSPRRNIDIYSIGRRQEGMHQTLLKLARERGLFYIYDTVQSGESNVSNYLQHRDLYANLVKRSRCFTVAPGKVNVPEETQGQVEIGWRYFEGAAAGAVMVGQAPDCDHFRVMFDWPDAVVEVATDGSDLADVLSHLGNEPERMLEISRRNAREALLRHDWVYRWKQVLRIAGLEPAPAMVNRERRLRELAAMAQNDG